MKWRAKKLFKIIRTSLTIGMCVIGLMWAEDIISFSQHTIIDSIIGYSLIVQMMFIFYAELISLSDDYKANRITVGIVVFTIATLSINPILNIVYQMFI